MASPISKVLETMWFFIGFITALLAIYQTTNVGIKESYTLYIVSGIAFAMYFFRRHLRNKIKNKH